MKQPETSSDCTVSSTCSGPLGTSCASGASLAATTCGAGAGRAGDRRAGRIGPVLLEQLAGVDDELAAQVEAEVVPGVVAQRRPASFAGSPSKYSAAKLRPPHHSRSASTTSILRWLRRLARPRRIERNGGTNFTTCTPERLSAFMSSRPPSQAPMPSIRRRTLTPRSAWLRRAWAISSPRPSVARMKVQTSIVRVAPAISSSTRGTRLGAVGVDAQAPIAGAPAPGPSSGRAGGPRARRPRPRRPRPRPPAAPAAARRASGACGCRT